MPNNSTKEDLVKLISEHPDLKLVFMAGDGCTDDYTYTLCNHFYCEVEYIYESDERIFVGLNDAVEYYCDLYGNDSNYSHCSNKEFEKLMTDKANELNHYQAIIVWINNI